MLEWPQHKILFCFVLIFSKHSRVENSAVRGLIWSKFEFIRDVIDVLVTFKNKEDPNKNEGARVATTLNIDFSHSQGSDLDEIRTHPRYYGYPCCFQV